MCVCNGLEDERSNGNVGSLCAVKYCYIQCQQTPLVDGTPSLCTPSNNMSMPLEKIPRPVASLDDYDPGFVDVGFS